jgi:stage III sporulation protein SpoIIIAA
MVNKPENIMSNTNAYDVHQLLDALPQWVRFAVLHNPNPIEDLFEVVLDLGRFPEARYRTATTLIGESLVTYADLQHVVESLSEFGEDNRSGMSGTLHRISAMRSRSGKVVGLTCRVGRAVTGTISIVQDLIESGQSVLLLGRPGVGKTTMLREMARVLADDLKKRVIIVDTSNEIAGDGDVPHLGIGRARRMQVPRPSAQHGVMIEAVENHMPEVIVIDEIGTELEAQASRTIAERGVQLIGTAHGQLLENLMMNPTLSDLVGGIQSVTLGDDEARRRGTQKTVLERKQPPTFDVLVEIRSWEDVLVYTNVGEAVDSLLSGQSPEAEQRTRAADGTVTIESVVSEAPVGLAGQSSKSSPSRPGMPMGTGPMKMSAPIPVMQKIYAYGLNRNKLEKAIDNVKVPAMIVQDIEEATMILTLKSYYRQGSTRIRGARQKNIPVHALRSPSMNQIEQSLQKIFRMEGA